MTDHQRLPDEMPHAPPSAWEGAHGPVDPFFTAAVLRELPTPVRAPGSTPFVRVAVLTAIHLVAGGLAAWWLMSLPLASWLDGAAGTAGFSRGGTWNEWGAHLSGAEFAALTQSSLWLAPLAVVAVAAVAFWATRHDTAPR